MNWRPLGSESSVIPVKTVDTVEEMYLVVHLRAWQRRFPLPSLPSYFLTVRISEDEDGILQIVLQQPHEGLISVRAELKLAPAQNQTAVAFGVAALCANTLFRLGLYGLGCLHRAESVLLWVLSHQGFLGGNHVQFPRWGPTKSWVSLSREQQ